MRKKYTKEDIEALISDDANFYHNAFMADREYENETYIWGKDGSCSISARMGKSTRAEQPRPKPRWTVRSPEVIDSL